MNSQDFLTLNILGAVAFLGWYLLSRGGSQKPTQLNLKAQDTAPTVLEPLQDQTQSVRDVKEVSVPVQASVVAVKIPEPKRTNIMFNYNGHSWDAYEVLGVPAGSSLKIVTEAYQVALRKAGPEAMEFLETAYKAILHKV